MQELEQKEQTKSDALWDEYFKVAMLPDSPAAPFVYHFGNTQTRAGGVMTGSGMDYAGQLLSAAGTAIEGLAEYFPVYGPYQNEIVGFNPSAYIPERDTTLIREYVSDPLREKGAELSAKGQAMVQAQKEGLGKFGRFAVDLGSAGTQMLLDISLGGGNMAIPAAIRTFGSSVEQAVANGAELNEQILYAGTSAALSYGIENVCNVAFSKLKAIAPGISDDFVTEGVDKLANKLASTPEGITALKNIGLMAASGLGEWAEGFLESAVEPYLRRLTYDKDAETIFQNSELLHDALYNSMIESILSVFGEGINLTVNSDVTANSDTPLQDSYKNPVQNSEGHGILGTEGDAARKPQQEFSPKELAEIGETLLSSGIMPDQKYLDAMGLSAADARGMWAVLDMGKQDAAADSNQVDEYAGQKANVNPTANTLTDIQKSRLNKLNNTINDHLTEMDFSGVLRDLQGNPVPHGTGGYFDHVHEMKDSYRSLLKIRKALEGSLKNPTLSDVDRFLLQDGLDKTNLYISRIEDLFDSYGGISQW